MAAVVKQGATVACVGDIEVGAVERNQVTIKSTGKVKNSRGNMYGDTNFYILQSRQYFSCKKFSTYIYFYYMYIIYLLIFFASLAAPANFIYAFVMTGVNGLFLLFYIQHLYVITKTMSYFRTPGSPYKTDRHNKNFEVFFRHVFTSVYPYSEVDTEGSGLAIPVQRLSHITHEKEADEICRYQDDDEDEKVFIFQSSKKVGKAYKWDGSPIGESFRDDFIRPGTEKIALDPDMQRYKYIKETESVVPEGYYSWWGISTAQWLSSVNEHPDLLRERAYGSCPLYLKNPPASLYGNTEFSGDLHQLLLSYQSLHSSSPDNPVDVYLLLGGTLRYRYEICCVVIVCAECYRNLDALKDYKPIPVLEKQSDNEGPILLQCLTNEDGRVTDYTGKSIPQFYPKLISSNKSWANLAFAFYFDSASDRKFKDLKRSTILHPEDKCVKKRPPKPYEKWLCPNRLSIT